MSDLKDSWILIPAWVFSLLWYIALAEVHEENQASDVYLERGGVF